MESLSIESLTKMETKLLADYNAGDMSAAGVLYEVRRIRSAIKSLLSITTKGLIGSRPNSPASEAAVATAKELLVAAGQPSA